MLVVTGHGSMDQAIQALKHDAADFILKPFDNHELVLSVENAVKRYELKAENKRLIKELSSEKERLQKMNEKLMELDQMKSSFVSTVSHELRTPLTVISSTVDNILDGIVGDVPPGQLKWLNMIKNNTERLPTLVEDILDIGRLESGKVDKRRDKVDIVSLVKKTAGNLLPLVQQNNIKLTVSVSNTLPVIDANSSRIEQVATIKIAAGIELVGLTARKKAIDDIVQSGEKHVELSRKLFGATRAASRFRSSKADKEEDAEEWESIKRFFQPFPIRPRPTDDHEIVIRPIQWEAA